MSELLLDDYWRCECEVPCNCATNEIVKKINPPELIKCAYCNGNKPERIIISHEKQKAIREERRRKRQNR